MSSLIVTHLAIVHSNIPSDKDFVYIEKGNVSVSQACKIIVVNMYLVQALSNLNNNNNK